MFSRPDAILEWGWSQARTLSIRSTHTADLNVIIPRQYHLLLRKRCNFSFLESVETPSGT